MKTTLCLVYLSFFFNSSLIAQKHDFNWMIGRGDFTLTEENENGLLLDFNNQQVQANIFEKDQVLFLTVLSYSNADGEFQLYSDGCAFYNEQGALLQNGDAINDADRCINGLNAGYTAEQGMIALPTSDEDIVAVFYNEEYIVDDALGVRIEVRLHRALIDLANDLVLSKKETVLDTLGGNILSATKHANGQDWWIINQDYFSNEYKCLLVSEGEVLDTLSTFIGNPIVAPGTSQSNFSPDGKYFARYSPSDALQIFSFDRSTGLLNDPQLINIPSTLTSTLDSGGLSFSGSSRFLYVNEALAIWQLDMHAEDIAASMVKVADREVFFAGEGIFPPTSLIPTFFFRQALAPDCRIYIASRSGVDRIYVIMEPELKGEACNVVQNIQLPIWNLGTIPHYPNYRLDTAPFCDSTKAFPSNLMTTVSTTTIAEPELKSRVHVFPNPASDYIQLYTKNLKEVNEVLFVLHDLLGRQIMTQQIALSEGDVIERIDLAAVPSGLYVYSVLDRDGGVLFSDRLVIE